MPTSRRCESEYDGTTVTMHRSPTTERYPYPWHASTRSGCRWGPSTVPQPAQRSGRTSGRTPYGKHSAGSEKGAAETMARGSERCQQGRHSTCKSHQCKAQGCMCHRYTTGWCGEGSPTHHLCTGSVEKGRPHVPGESRTVTCHCQCHSDAYRVAKAIATLDL